MSAIAVGAPAARLWSRLGGWAAGLFLAALLIVTVLSGWISLHEGMNRFLWPFSGEVSIEAALDKAATVRAHPTDENMRAVSEELWGLSKLVSVQHFSGSKLIEQGSYYALMPTANQALLLAHVLLSVFCMLFGALQFWPHFRKRFMKSHRAIGAIYILTVPPAVLTALAYLALTPPHHIYDHLVAWIALWAFGLLALVAIFLAVQALRGRRIHEHQAWMAISFGCLLVAPLLRWDWVWLAWLMPGIDQETLNLVTMGLMLPECLLIAYFLILINRQYTRPASRRTVSALSLCVTRGFQRLLPGLQGLALLTTLASIAYLLAGQGMAGFDWFTGLAPAALIAREQAALQQPFFGFGLAIGLGVALSLALHVLGRLLSARQISDVSARTRLLGRVVAVSGLLAGLAAIAIGWHIGLADQNRWLSGGTLYTVNGGVIAGFALFHLLATQRGHLALMKESLVFLLAMLPFPALFLLTGWIVHLVGLPADYLAAGQGFVLPVGFSSVLLFPALLHVAFNQATREHN